MSKDFTAQIEQIDGVLAFGQVGFAESDWYDPWGCAMAWAFALNDYSHDHGTYTDPSYVPAMGGSDTEAPEYEMLVAANVDLGCVLAAIRLISVLLDDIRAAGLDY